MPDALLTPDVGGMRRFALIMGILTLTWASAGMSLDSEAPISLLGVPLRVARGDLLPIGLALASLYGAVRYYYYGIMLGTSPYRMRRDILDEMVVHWNEMGQGRRTKVGMYSGPVTFTTGLSHYDRSVVEGKAAELRESFPKFAGARVKAEVSSSRSIDDEGDEYSTHSVAITIPIRCRVAAVIEDADYTMPVWLNGLALTLMLL